MSYSKKDIIDKVREALKNPATLYQADFVNYIGDIGDEWYTEIAAREIMRCVKTDNLSSFLNGIEMISRRSSYKTESHKELAKREKPANSSRDEEWIAIGMYGKTFDHIGEILDFQIPLKNVAADMAGKIDLISYNKVENTVYILELKKPESDETLLRCVLEAYTYWKTVDREKLLRDFGVEGAALRKAVLVFQNCVAYSDFQDDKCEATYCLMGKLGVDLFALNDDGSNVIEGYKH